MSISTVQRTRRHRSRRRKQGTQIDSAAEIMESRTLLSGVHSAVSGEPASEATSQRKEHVDSATSDHQNFQHQERDSVFVQFGRDGFQIDGAPQNSKEPDSSCGTTSRGDERCNTGHVKPKGPGVTDLSTDPADESAFSVHLKDGIRIDWKIAASLSLSDIRPPAYTLRGFADFGAGNVDWNHDEFKIDFNDFGRSRYPLIPGTGNGFVSGGNRPERLCPPAPKENPIGWDILPPLGDWNIGRNPVGSGSNHGGIQLPDWSETEDKSGLQDWLDPGDDDCVL